MYMHVFQLRPAKIRQHLGHTAARAKIIAHKSSCTALHILYFTNIASMIWVACPVAYSKFDLTKLM